jgi:adenylate kinase family enzyme
MTQTTTDPGQFDRLERVNVVGTSGSGKTTFARELSRLLDLPYHEMDQLFWKPRWQESPRDEFLRKVRGVTDQTKWVLDGNYSRTIAVKWQQVQVVVWLDLSFVRTVLRVTRRAIGRSLTRHELWPGTGNRESLAKAFLSRDSIILWAMTSYRKNRKKYRSVMIAPEYSHIRFVRLTSPAAVVAWLEQVRQISKDGAFRVSAQGNYP